MVFISSIQQCVYFHFHLCNLMQKRRHPFFCFIISFSFTVSESADAIYPKTKTVNGDVLIDRNGRGANPIEIIVSCLDEKQRQAFNNKFCVNIHCDDDPWTNEYALFDSWNRKFQLSPTHSCSLPGLPSYSTLALISVQFKFQANWKQNWLVFFIFEHDCLERRCCFSCYYHSKMRD